MSTCLRPAWRILVAVLLLLALPLQAAELARMVVCPPAVARSVPNLGQDLGHDHGAVVSDAGAHHHDDLPATADDPAENDAQGHAHAGSSCCKTCLAGCAGWVMATPLDWPAPGWTAASFPSLTTAAVPEPLPRGLERPPRTATA